MVDPDHAWAVEVVGACDPVFRAADVGFVHQVGYGDEHRRTVVSLLWEADPTRFADRYPESGIIESYGADQWPGVHCVDFWVYVEPEAGRCRLSVEGWNLPELFLELRGIGAVDGANLADTFARILGVTSPRVTQTHQPGRVE
ncbi:hypothetical protein ASC64_17640 [Nocardioides sp. Root122]|uniref:hypothetical protein n=1 Tax=Nocardioides TaxID=1839 RepID=UPI0007031E45|nr:MULTISPECIES: hypothetical protein [Nocardioides]KQV62908.1 hypothetical protein ASC64_17640 [Nocardioides sp. Root122]MCK9823929.1 hypothetical protein [Nocardioides cavernae]